MQAVVLAGGFGTRLKTVVADLPKPMAPVCGRPFLRFILDALAAASFTRVVLAVGYLADTISDYFGGSYRGMELVYSIEEHPLGTGGAIAQALRLCDDDRVFVLNGDTFATVDYVRMDGLFESFHPDDRHPDVLMASRTMHDFDRYGTLDLDGRRVVGFNEKRPCRTGVISVGVYLMRRSLMDGMPEVFSIETDFFEKRVGDLDIEVFPIEGTFIDIGIPSDYDHAQTSLRPYADRGGKIAFLDRDGTINVDTGHLHEVDRLVLIPGTVSLMHDLADKGYRLVVCTNQAGIAKGLYGVDEMYRLHAHLNELLGREGLHIDAFYFCPHHPDYTGPCSCRKPEPGMFLKALSDYEVAPADCVAYGDKESDLAAARAAGIADVHLVGEQPGLGA